MTKDGELKMERVMRWGNNYEGDGVVEGRLKMARVKEG